MMFWEREFGNDAGGNGNPQSWCLQEPDTSATEPLRLVVGFEPAVGFKPAAATPVCNAASWRLAEREEERAITYPDNLFHP